MKSFIAILQLLAVVSSLSQHRYNNRMLRPMFHKRLPPRTLQQSDCLFNICENVSSYPEQDVNRIVDKHQSFHSFLKGRVISPVKTIAISARDGREEKTFCKTKDILAAPKLMMDIDNIRRHIVNLKNYSQVLKFQTCIFNDGEECFKETILGLKTKCVQKYNNIKLVTVDVNNELLEYRIFRIPTTCVCTYTKEFS